MQHVSRKAGIAAALVAVAALLIMAAAWLAPGQDGRAPAPESTEAVFTSPESGESITVAFDREGATLFGAGYEDVRFKPAVSASGARYVNEEEGLELWNRGEAITLSRGGEQLFMGNIGGLTDADKLAGSVWVWQATTIGDAVTEPRQADVFTLSFDRESGRVSGTTDCNGLGGSYAVGADNALAFTEFVSTQMYCEGSQEAEFAAALMQAERFFFAGSGALVLELKGGGTMLFGERE